MRPLPFLWPYALAFWAVYAWAFLEERALVDTIGEPYRFYMKTRKRFIPYIV